MRIGITSTIPVEYIFAAGHVPVDLNNIFISDDDPQRFIVGAEAYGLQSNLCSWVKGLYGVVQKEDIRRLVIVVEGDCSPNRHLAELFRSEGRDVFCFSYPFDRSETAIKTACDGLARWLGTGHAQAQEMKRTLDTVRARLSDLDRWSYERMTVTGAENHLWLVSSSDFCGDHVRFDRDLTAFLTACEKRDRPQKRAVRLGYVGVPPIVKDLYRSVEEKGGLVVYNEVQRQFAMLETTGSIFEQYARYTYPYGIEARIPDIQKEVARRKLDGIIHYVQSFCAQSMNDILLRKALSIPVLTIECDAPGMLDGKNRTKIEAFLERWV